MCCVCAGTCNHVGNHFYCSAHGGSPWGLATQTVATNWTLNWTYDLPRTPRQRIGDTIQRFGRWIGGI